MASTTISARSHNLSIAVEPDKAMAIAESPTFEALFYNLELSKYRGFDPQNGTTVRHRESIAIVINCLIRADLWRGRVIGIDGDSKQHIDQDEDSKVRIPEHLLKESLFTKIFAIHNERIKNSEWPYENIPRDYGLRDKVKGLLGLQTQAELDSLNPKREIEYAPGALARIVYESTP